MKTVILTPSGATISDFTSGSYPTYPAPNNSQTRIICPWEGGVASDFLTMSSIELIILSENAGNLYLQGGASRFDLATLSAIATSSSGFAAYAGGAADSKLKFITLPSTSWSSLAAINASDSVNIIIDRDATNVLDTYEHDLNVVGVRIKYNAGAAPGSHYCTQTDLENRISPLTLAQLTNDTAGATSADASVLDSILALVDAQIDGKAGQVYTVPFSPVPNIIRRIAVAMSCYFCFQRRPVNMDMPKDWQVAYDNAIKILEDVSNLLVYLPDTATLSSTQADMNTLTDNPVVDFFNSDSPMSLY